jgi:hypothetical protein
VGRVIQAYIVPMQSQGQQVHNSTQQQAVMLPLLRATLGCCPLAAAAAVVTAAAAWGCRALLL